MPSRLVAATTLSALLVVSACAPSRPSEHDVASAILKDDATGHGGHLWIGLLTKNIDQKGADCMARVLVRSTVSTDALNAIVDHDASYAVSTSLQRALAPLYGDLGACMRVPFEDPKVFLNH